MAESLLTALGLPLVIGGAVGVFFVGVESVVEGRIVVSRKVAVALVAVLLVGCLMLGVADGLSSVPDAVPGGSDV